MFYKAVLFTFGELYGIITLGSYLLDKLEFGGGHKMIRLEKVCAKNVWDIIKLEVEESQDRFVASNKESIIDAYTNAPVAIEKCDCGVCFTFGEYASYILKK